MSNEKFTQGEWYLGNPFRHKDSKSEWCNLYADGEKNPIAVVLLNDGCGETYHNDTLIEAAPEMYRMLKYLADGVRWGGIQHTDRSLALEIENLLKKARGIYG